MFSQFFVLSLRGDTILHKDCKNRLAHKTRPVLILNPNSIVFSQKGSQCSQLSNSQHHAGDVFVISRHLELLLRGHPGYSATILCKLDAAAVAPYPVRTDLRLGTARGSICIHQAQSAVLRLHVSESQDSASPRPRTAPNDCGSHQ